MTITLRVGDTFPDIVLPNHRDEPTHLSHMTRPGQLDEKLGFFDGYPLIVVIYRGFFCPRDQRQMRQLVEFQHELDVNFARLVAIGVDPPRVQAAFRAGLGARWPFLSDQQRTVTNQIGILDETEGEYAYAPQPYTFVLRPDLTIHAIYNGWFFVGRPTLEELRRDLRAIMETLSNYGYEAYATPEARQVRIPQQEWIDGPPLLGKNGLPVANGVIRWFDYTTGNGMIDRGEGSGTDVFFNFTAIPGEGYRTIKPGTAVKFEVVEGPFGTTARNVQRVDGDA